VTARRESKSVAQSVASTANKQGIRSKSRDFPHTPHNLGESVSGSHPVEEHGVNHPRETSLNLMRLVQLEETARYGKRRTKRVGR
jgi:hypothetical protein